MNIFKDSDGVDRKRGWWVSKEGTTLDAVADWSCKNIVQKWHLSSCLLFMHGGNWCVFLSSWYQNCDDQDWHLYREIYPSASFYWFCRSD